MNNIYKICAYIVFGAIVAGVSNAIESDYLKDFLAKELLSIIITLLAINVASSAFLISKLDDVRSRYKLSFLETVKSIKLSIIEQLALIVTTILLGILDDSIIDFECKSFMVFSLRTSVLIITLQILWDIGLLMFDIFTTLDEVDQKKINESDN